MPPVVPKSVLTQYFETGDKPSASQFGSLIRSMANLIDDRYLLGLRVYDPLKQYFNGDAAIYANALFECTTDTTGAFNPADWNLISPVGSVIYAGTWFAKSSQNIPLLQSGIGTKGFYYVVTDADANPANNVTLDGINDWRIGDWAIFNGTAWQIVRNSEVPIKAEDVIFEPAGGISSDNVQDAIVEVAEAKQDLLDLTPNFYPYASDTSELSDGVISNQSDGVALTNGKVFRSSVPFKAQLHFGSAGNSVFLTTDSGKFFESTLDLEADSLYLKHAPSGKISIGKGSDSKGEIRLINSVNNFIDINGDAVVAAHASGAQLKISSGTAETFSDVIKLTSSNIFLGNLNADTVLFLDGSKKITSSIVTSAELGYLSGVTSSVQDQLDDKQDALGYTPVPDTRTVNGHSLTSNVTVLASEVPQDSSNRFVTDGQIASWDAKQGAITTGTTIQYFRGDLSLAVLNAAAVGLGNVDNTSDVNKPVSTAQAAADAAVLASAQTYAQDPNHITQDSTHNFVTNAQIATWNAKQNALTTGTTAQYFRGDLSLATLNAAAVGLGNVNNTSDVNKPVSTAQATADAAVLASAQTYAQDPSHITQDSTHNFVTNAQITTWNAKQNAITTGTTAQYFRGDLSLATFNSAAIGLGNVTNDQQLSLKTYFADESTVWHSSSATFFPNDTGFTYIKAFSVAVAGTYLLDWYYEIGSSTTAGDAGSQVSLDLNVYASSSIKGGVADGFVSTRGFIQLPSPLAAGSHTFRIELNRPTSGGIAAMRRPRFTLTKV